MVKRIKSSALLCGATSNNCLKLITRTAEQSVEGLFTAVIQALQQTKAIKCFVKLYFLIDS